VTSVGRPDGMSPAGALADPRYEKVAVLDAGAAHGVPVAQCVVRHRASGTLWACWYAVRDDDSDADAPAAWVEAEAREKVTVEYVTKGGTR